MRCFLFCLVVFVVGCGASQQNVRSISLAQGEVLVPCDEEEGVDECVRQELVLRMALWQRDGGAGICFRDLEPGLYYHFTLYFDEDGIANELISREPLMEEVRECFLHSLQRIRSTERSSMEFMVHSS